ncbi:MAG: hypothetical protein KAI66_12155, partial [Lentisphaeria bacterium]|nr:hypothetical protein [Lentisphaeria bacterium]
MGKQETHAIRIDIANAEVLPEHTFAHQTANCYSHHYGPYNKTNKAWMNYHWRVFRAKGKTAKLTVSDWATPTATGGPIGQRLLYNYVVVQPFFEAK